jgi:hypothetical protein
MVKHVEDALRLVNRCLLLCNLFETLGPLMYETIALFNNRTLHLFYRDESPYV